MKKNVLSLSISAAVLSLGFAGGAQAITAIGYGSASAAAVSANGVGHILLVPYYTANGDNRTQINIVNTDMVNGKAVKVRFRSAANSDDVSDFQVFLSPGDVWSGEVSRDTTVGSDGKAMISTSDTTCTKPTLLGATTANRLFKTGRLDNTAAAATNATRAAATREGYIEILTMADIRPLAYTATNATLSADANGTHGAGVETVGTAANALFTAIKHTATGGAPPCSGTAWTNLDTNLADLIAAAGAGLARPTGSLMANWTILNTTTSAAYGGTATAIALTGTAVAGGGALANTGNLTYWPQSTVTGTPAAAAVAAQTADPLLRTATPIVIPTNVDLPDLSTPFLGQGANGAASVATVNAGQNDTTFGPINTANQLSAVLAKTSVTNEYQTSTGFNGSTDWTFSMPTRRYGVVYNYVDGKAYFNITPTSVAATGASISNYFSPTNAIANSGRRMVCVVNVQPVASNREELIAGSTVMSPADAPQLCGEVSVLSINNAASATSNSLLATATLNDLDVGAREGWLRMDTPGLGAGLPIIGHSFVRAFTGTLNIGAAYAHR